MTNLYTILNGMFKFIDIISVVFFCELMQRIFKYGDNQNTSLTPDKEVRLDISSVSCGLTNQRHIQAV